jgi:hypothetical protein
MVMNSKIQQNRGGDKYHSPMVLHGKITKCRETKKHKNGTKGQGKPQWR